MTNGKINRKYFAFIWLALIAAFFLYNAYDIYLYVTNITETGSLVVFIAILRILFSDGILPTAIVFVCAFVVWQIGAARYVRCISRNDFCYLAMLFTAAVKFLIGFIQVFSILEPNIYAFTSSVLDSALMTGAMLGMFFYMAKSYRFNPVEKYNAFRMWSTIYMIVAGLAVIGENGLILMLSDGSEFSMQVLAQMYAMGYYIYITDLQIGMSIAAICIYGAYLVTVIVLGELMRKQSDRFRNPETRGEFYSQYDNRAYSVRNDSERVFGDDGFGGSDGERRESKKEDEHVFDEFDL